MKSSFLLTVGLLLAGSVGVQAQVFEQGFESEQSSDTTAVGWYQFINNQTGDTREISTDAHSGSGAMHFFNSEDVIGSSWQRAIKFRNLPIEENTSYRLSFYLKGNNTYTDTTATVKSKAHFALMQGGENADVAFVTPDGTTTFSNDISYFSEDTYVKYTGMFFYGTNAAQKAYYATQNPGAAELADKWFATINVYNPGDYYLDDVQLIKSTIAGVTFKNDVAKVDFGYSTNIASLVSSYGEDGRLVLPNSCVSLTLNGEQAVLQTVELHSDGYLYIFLGNDAIFNDGDKVEVSFTNPTDSTQLKYSGSQVPNLSAVADFSNEEGEYDENISDDLYSWAYVTPSLKSADPENGSFDLPLSTNTFKVTFNKPVECDAVEAQLGAESLSVSPSTGYSNELTLTRTSSTDITAGEYDLTITKVYPELKLDDNTYGTFDLDLTFGTSSSDPNDTAKVVMKDSIAETISDLGEGYIPYGWTIYNASTEVSQGTNPGIGPRSFSFASGGDFTGALYIRTAAADDGGCAEYGLTENYYLALEANKKYKFTYNVAAWKGTPYVKFELIDPTGADVISRIDAAVPNMNGSKTNAITSSTAVEETYRPTTGGNYVMKWTPVADADGNGAAWLEVLLGNVKVTYIPNAAGVVEKNLLKEALASANSTLASDNGERYSGIDYNTLQATVNKYTGQSSTSPTWYKNAAAELNTANTAMQTHRTLCDTYDPLVAKAQSVIDTIPAKYQKYAQFKGRVAYTQLLNVIARYTGQVLTDNDSLQTAISELDDSTRYLVTCERCVGALTTSIKSGISTLNLLGASNEALSTAAGNALTDDAALKAQIKKALTLAVYGALKESDNTVFADKVDTTTLETYKDSLDMSIFLENPEFYFNCLSDGSNSSEVSTEGVVSDTTLVGWNIVLGDGWTSGLSYHYPWAWFSDKSTWSYSTVNSTNPVANGAIAIWGRETTISQTITDLPAGTYEIWTGAGDRNSDDKTSPNAWLKYETSEVNDSVAMAITSGSDDVISSGTIVKDLTVTDGKLTLTFYNTSTARPLINYVHLYMTAPADGFNYANAYTTGIQEVGSANVTVKKTEYYGINGQKLSTPQKGIVIVKQTLSNGRVKVSKRMIR